MAIESRFVDNLLGSLADNYIVRFEAGVAEQVHEFFIRAQAEHELSEPVVEQATGLACLNTSEVALLGQFLNESDFSIYNDEPLLVTERAASFALLKGDCSLIIWTHPTPANRMSSIAPTDLLFVSGDISKLNKLRPGWELETAQNPEVLDEVVASMKEVYRQSSLPVARDAEERGMLDLQGLLWKLKASIVYGGSVDDLDRLVYSYREGLTRGLGV